MASVQPERAVPSPERRSSSIARVGRAVHRRSLGLAAKAAIAAGIAWALGLKLPGSLGHYSYYAPLGALSVMYAGITDSLREALRATVAVALGVLVSVLLHAIAGPNAITVGLAIGVGILIGNLRVLGEQGSWVPLAALFVFTVPDTDLHDFAGAYLLQLVVGMAVGLVVNFVLFPSLALHDVQRRASDVRGALVDALRALAEALREPRGTAQEERLVRSALEELPDRAAALREMTARSQRAATANPRRRRWRTERADVLAYGESAQGAATLVEDLARELLAAPGPVLDADRRAALADAADAVAATLEESRHGVTSAESVERAERRLRRITDDDPYLAVRFAHALRRCLHLTADWDAQD